MPTSTCSRCEDLRKSVLINGPAEMEGLLKVVRSRLDDGSIVGAAYWPKGQVKLALADFLSIPVCGPWPDYLEYYFACATCGRLYRLTAETYRGFGGSWSHWEPGRTH